VESVTVSYLIYAPAQTNFGSYGGIINESNLKGPYHKKLSYLFPSHNFQAIFGLSSLAIPLAADNSFDFQSQLTPYYEFSYGVKTWQLLENLEISYVIAGLMPATLCDEVSECKA
jgi:hypothetical protein